MFKINLIIAVAGLGLLSGCASKPLSLTLAVHEIYCMDTACFCVHEVAARRYFQTLETLKQDNDIELELVYFTEPYLLEEAICSGNYDGVLSKPWTALRLQKESGASFYRIVDVLDPNNNQWLSGIVIVPADSPIQSLEELTGKQVFLGQDDAYEKHQAAKRLFAQQGIEPAKIETKASCSENIGVLLDEEADAAVISDYALSADCAVDFANPEDFRILEYTEKIPLTSLMVDLNKISKADADRLQRALLALSGPDAPESLLGNGFIAPTPWNPPELEKQP